MLLKHGGIVFKISEFNDEGVILQSMSDHVKKIVDENSLIEKIQSCDIQQVNFPSEITKELSEKTKNEIMARQESEISVKVMIQKLKWLDELERVGISKLVNTPRVRSTIDRLSLSTLQGLQKFKISTLANARLVYDSSGSNPISLLPSFSKRGGQGKSRIHPELETIVQEELINTNKKVGKIIKQHVIEKIQERSRELIHTNPSVLSKIPSASTLSRRFDKEISKYKICCNNEGKARANRLYRDNGARITASHPLEVVEYDDIDTGIFMIDQKTKLPAGRGYLTSGIDQCTLVVMGFSIGYEHRSSQSAIHAITDSLLPKNTDLPEFKDLQHSWIGYGTAGINILDNPAYNHSNETLGVQLKLKQACGWSRPFQPGDKSCIEHFNHRIKNDFTSRIPGWRKSKDNEFGHRTGIDEAVITIQEYRRKFVEWVVGEYSHDAGEDGLSPNQRWMRYYQYHRPAVSYTREQIAFIRMTPKMLTLRESGGLLHMALRYKSDELNRLRKHIGPTSKVLVYTHEDDLSYLLVQNPHTKALFRANCIEDENYLRYLTRKQHQLILKMARQLGIEHPDWQDCIRARTMLEQETERLCRDKSLRKRNYAVINAMPEKSAIVSGESKILAKSEERIVTDIEYSMFQLDQIVLGDEDSWS